MMQFKAFKPQAMNKIAQAMGYQGDMNQFQQYIEQDPARQQQMSMYNDAAVKMAQGGAVPPRRTEIKGQDHMLAYITPQEGELLKAHGGSGKPGPMGIPSFEGDGGDDHFIENITPADWHLLWDTMMSFTDESWKADQDRKLE